MAKSDEQRKFLRVPAELPVVYWATGSNARESGEATSIDVSGAGLRLRTVEPMKPGQPIEIEVKLPAPHKPIRAQVRVVRSILHSREKTITTQVAFQSIDESDCDRLVGYVYRRQIAARKRARR